MSTRCIFKHEFIFPENKIFVKLQNSSVAVTLLANGDLMFMQPKVNEMK